MRNRLSLILVTMAALALAAGCVTTKKFETAMGDVSTRVDGVQTKVETQSGRIDKLEERDQQLAGDIQKVGTEVGTVRESANTAMTRAEEAHKAARGKVIWQVTLNNNDVRFKPDGFELTDDGRGALDQLVEKVKGLDRMVFIEVQGHTDSRGSEKYNEELGLRRASAVRDYLHDKGIPLNLISTISYGDKKPIANNKTRDGRAENRRVEILVLE